MGGVFLLVKRWSLTSEWKEVHRWALCFGALLVCMTGGFLGAGAWPLMDIVAKGLLNLLAIAGMVRLAALTAKGSKEKVLQGG